VRIRNAYHRAVVYARSPVMVGALAAAAAIALVRVAMELAR